MHDNLFQVLAFLGSSILLVSICQKAGLGSILGYLAAGILIGPQGLGVILDYHYTQSFAEYGVVFLLFVIGLELQPRKLWGLRRTLIGFGGMQVLFCTLAFALIAKGFDLSWPTSLVIGFALSLSSTAFAIQSLSERKVLNTEFGRSAFAILLMQDVFAIPALAFIPTLGIKAASGSGHADANWGGALLIILALAILSKTLMGPFLRIVAGLRSRELFTGVTLFIVMGVAFAMEEVGLSMALGAFLAGVFLSESEYRHELEADLDPFKGILMGLFFVSVGMGLNLSLLLSMPVFILAATLAYLVVKAVLLYVVGRLMRLRSIPSQNLAAYVTQGGEFAFVLFGVGISSKVLPEDLAQKLTLIVTLSMVISPFIIIINDRISARRSKFQPTKEYDRFEDANNKVIIAGFGRFGQIFGRILRAQDINFTAIDHDSEQIELLRTFGNKVYYGDASRKEILEAAGAKDADFFILAVDDMETSVLIAETIRTHYPHLKVYARSRNRQHTFNLMEMGVKHIRRETFDSSLTLTGELLLGMGFTEKRAHSVIERFKKHDELMLAEQFKFRHDQPGFINISRIGTQQLAQVLREDAEKTYIDAKDLHEQ
jgi:monovalent cation:proton antiporter-2 (CPA2) family protein